jgi:hypothetical protein
MRMDVLLEKLVAGVTVDPPSMMRREVRIPNIPNKAVAV